MFQSGSGPPTKGDVEPGSQQLQQPSQSLQQRQLELVVVGQVDEDRAQAGLQELLRHLLVRNHGREPVLSLLDRVLVRARQLLEQHLYDLVAQLPQLTVVPVACRSRTSTRQP